MYGSIAEDKEPNNTIDVERHKRYGCEGSL